MTWFPSIGYYLRNNVKKKGGFGDATLFIQSEMLIIEGTSDCGG